MAEGVQYPTDDHITADQPGPDDDAPEGTEPAPEGVEPAPEGATTAGGEATAAPTPDATEGTVPG